MTLGKLKIIIVLVSVLFFSIKINAEGTKQFRPTYNNSSGGFININNPGNFLAFATFGGPVDGRLNIQVGSLTERVYYGFGNIKLAQYGFNPNEALLNVNPLVFYRIISPSGVIVVNDTVPIVGEGFVGDHTQASYDLAVAGPAELVGATGYDALKFIPTEIGDYHIEFECETPNQQFSFQLFDITVSTEPGANDNDPNDPDAPGAGVAVDGRLWSKAWMLSAGNAAPSFSTNFFVYTPDQTVSKIVLPGLNPSDFQVYANSRGTTDTSNNILFNKISNYGNQQKTEFPIFLNTPDPNIYITPPSAWVDSINIKVCLNSDYCINVYSTGVANADVYIDINANGNPFDPDDIIIPNNQLVAGENCISWDGKNKLGVLLPNLSPFQVLVHYKVGEVNFVVYDVESNNNGFLVENIAPLVTNTNSPFVPLPKKYWADTLIVTGTAIDALNDFDILFGGCTVVSGCHLWQNRGAFFVPNTEESINTWWYAKDTILTKVGQASNYTLALGPDQALCNVDSVVLTVPDIFSSIVWSTGSTNDTLSVNTPGVYWVDVTTPTCVARDSIVINDGLSIELGNDTVLCPGESLNLVIFYEEAMIAWSDGSTDPSLLVNAPGTYSVTVKKFGCEIRDTVFVSYQPTVNLPLIGADTVICNFVPFSEKVDTYAGATYLWTGGSTDSIFTYTQPGNYAVSVIYGRCVTTDQRFIGVPPTLNFGPDTLICEGQPLTLSFPQPNSVYNWSTGETGSSITVNQTGNYWLNMTYYGCPLNDSINLVVRPNRFVFLGLDSNLCKEADITLFNPYDTVAHVWSTGETGKNITVTNTGNYALTFFERCYFGDDINLYFDECPSAPNIFTPNNDGINDVFMIKDLGPWSYSLEIFSRWGQKVFETDSPKGVFWDGFGPSGLKHPEGTYFYTLTNKDLNKKFKGHLTLLR